MPFGKKLEDLFNKGRAEVENRLKENHSSGSNAQAGYPGSGNPPPIPTASKPAARGNAYCKSSYLRDLNYFQITTMIVQFLSTSPPLTLKQSSQASTHRSQSPRISVMNLAHMAGETMSYKTTLIAQQTPSTLLKASSFVPLLMVKPLGTNIPVHASPRIRLYPVIVDA